MLCRALQSSRKRSFAINGSKICGCFLHPQTRDKDALTDEGVGNIIAELRTKFDWILCDSPAGIERGALLAMRYADEAVIVTNPEVSSVRDSDRIIGMLNSKTVKAERGERIEKHVLITRYDFSARITWRNAQHRRYP